MAKRFRLRLSRVIPSFQSCRSKDDAGVTLTTPSFRLSPVNHKALDIDFPPPPSPAAPPFLRRHPPVVSAACGCRPSRRGGHFSAAGADAEADDLALARETPAYLWRKEEKWHVVAYAAAAAAAAGGNGGDFPSSPRRKIDSDDGGDIFPPVAMARARRREAERRRLRRRAEARRSSRYRGRVSTSSADSGWFSSEGDEENDEREGGDYFDEEEEEDDDDDETETLVSSTDNSSDNVLRRRRMRRRRRGEVVKCLPSPEGAAAAVLRRLVPCGVGAVAEGKVRGSFAVVKRSEDPRADFRRSMAEMVVEKELYEAGDLEQLLHCFLSLNSRRHHAAIVAAFSDIWDALFPATATPTTVAPTFPKISYK